MSNHHQPSPTCQATKAQPKDDKVCNKVKIMARRLRRYCITPSMQKKLSWKHTVMCLQYLTMHKRHFTIFYKPYFLLCGIEKSRVGSCTFIKCSKQRIIFATRTIRKSRAVPRAPTDCIKDLNSQRSLNRTQKFEPEKMFKGKLSRFRCDVGYT